MPNSIITTFANKSGKPESEVEQSWEKAKDIVAKQYPEVENGSESFYKLVTGVLKKMLSIKTENDAGSIGIADVKAGTHEPFTKYHKKKRALKKTVTEAFDKIASMSKDERGIFFASQSDGIDIPISMIENIISTDQLKESISHLKLGEVNETSSTESLLYLDSAIKKAITDKQHFASFVEDVATNLTGAHNLNENGFEYPGYDICFSDVNFISVKSSSTKHTVNEAYRNSNSIKTSALILSALYRMDKQLFKENCSFSDISNLLQFKDQLLEFVQEQDTNVGFMIAYISKNNEFKMHFTHAVQESKVLEHCFDLIENAQGKARSKFFASYNKLVEFCGSDTVTTIQLMDDSEYAALRENIINTITNIKDYDLMCKIKMLLQ